MDGSAQVKVEPHLRALVIKIGIGVVGNHSAVNIDSHIVGGGRQPDGAAVGCAGRRLPQPQMVALVESIERLLQSEILLCHFRARLPWPGMVSCSKLKRSSA